MQNNEIWRDVVGYEGLYMVSENGAVRNCKTNKVLATKVERQTGYCKVNLSKNGVSKWTLLHRVIAKAFIPNPENKPCIDHINTNRQDNRLTNLRWVTHTENMNNPLSKIKISEAGLGHRHTEETKRKMSQTRMGHPTSETTRQKIKMSNPNKRPVICLDTNEVFNTYNDAGRKYGLGLWLALKENRRYKGMMFKYMDTAYAS